MILQKVTPRKITSFEIQNTKKSSRAQIDTFGIARAEDRERPQLRHADASQRRGILCFASSSEGCPANLLTQWTCLLLVIQYSDEDFLA